MSAAVSFASTAFDLVMPTALFRDDDLSLRSRKEHPND
jgi:hypothetical protein